MIRVITPGPMLTIQDAGRSGFRHLGITKSGAADPLALSMVNRLLGNAPGAPALEVTLGLCKLAFEQNTRFALMGADMQVELDGKRVFPGWQYDAKKGQTLIFKTARQGMRSYLGVVGGLSVPGELGSASMDQTAGIGPFGGTPLKAGNLIATQSPSSRPVDYGICYPPFSSQLRVIPGPDAGLLTSTLGHDAFSAFLSTSWHLSPASNRMGLRLQTDQSPLEHTISLPTRAVHHGIIQLPPDGKPIILMPDCQTTGGYPVIGIVTSADFPSLAQIRPGDKVTFSYLSEEDSVTAISQQKALLRRIEFAIQAYSDKTN